MALDPSQPFNDAIATSLKLSVTQAAGNQRVGVANDGATMHARAQVPRITASWQKYQVTLTTGRVSPSASGVYFRGR